MKILLTSTSFQDTPGAHHTKLEETGWTVDFLRGPLKEEVLLPIIANYDGIICGDDEITEEVVKRGAAGNLKAISKYGIGLDKIDLNATDKYHISVFNTPGVNHIAVAEHAFMFLLTHFKNFYNEVTYVRNGRWKRLIGHEVLGKKVAILGLGRIGKEFALRCKAFGLNVWGYDISYDSLFMKHNGIKVINSMGDIDSSFNIISLHLPLTLDTKNLVNEALFEKMNKAVLLINTGRAGLIEKKHLEKFLATHKSAAYYCDVLWDEPITEDETLLNYSNVFITPHIGSRTYESVERQGSKAVTNMIKALTERIN